MPRRNQAYQRAATAPAAPAITTALLRFIRRTARGEVNCRPRGRCTPFHDLDH